MSHELEILDGRAVFLGRVPAWHKLGQVVGDDFGLDEVREQAPEVLMPVRMEVPYVLTDNGPTPLLKTGAIVREDGAIVGEGIGQETYGIVQPLYAFEFGQELAGITEMPLVSAGNIRGGSQFFFTYAAGHITCGDYAEDINLSITSSHDGSLSLMALFSRTVIVCANTQAMALRGATNRIVFKHTSQVEDRMKAFLDTQEGVIEYRKAVQAQVESLAVTRMNLRQFDALLDGVLPVLDEEARNKNQRDDARMAIRALSGAPVVGEFAGTALGFIQAVNTYENWGAPVRGRNGRSEATLRAERQFDAMVKGNQPLTTAALEAVGSLVSA